ncbi:TetR/AcrR family transcriptional regulator [uncultured Dialister sp.]|uniref:TetR/AcrR family transcriptional regulator n=1 Tax=uncultured Dialister sp. TaxID=278064 RepID=UPI0025F1BB2F|nr:TetR/AcrR family transcriptional regulator [uncultured Dialister sp.]
MKERLIKATLEEMKTRSLKFTMDDLARKLHASKSSIYKVVDSKEDLIRLVVHWAMDIFERKEEILIHGKGPVNSRLIEFCGLFFKTFWYMPKPVYEDLQNKYEDIWKEWDDYRESKFDDIMRFLEEGVKTGEYRPVNLKIVRQCVFHAAWGMTDPKFLAEMNMTGSDMLEALEDIILNGLKAGEHANIRTVPEESEKEEERA